RRDAVSVEIPIQNRRRSARMITEHGWIEGEAREYNYEQGDTREPKSSVRNAMKKPAECCAFQRPANRDPLSIELDRENQRDEEKRCATEERELRVARGTVERCALQQNEKPQQRRYSERRRDETRNSVWMRG